MRCIGIKISMDSVLVAGNRKVYYEDSFAVLKDRQGNILARGNEAYRLQEPAFQLVQPMKEEPVNPKEILDALLDILENRHLTGLFIPSSLVLFSPSILTRTHLIYLHKKLYEYGFTRIYSFPQMSAAAAGSGYDISSSFVSCIVCIDSSECMAALFQEGQMIFQSEYFLAGEQIDAAIYNWILNLYQLEVSELAVMEIRQALFSLQTSSFTSMRVQGFSPAKNALKEIELDLQALQMLLLVIARKWVQWLGEFIHQFEVQEQLDVFKRGIICCGSIFALEGLDQYFQQVLGCPVFVCSQPEQALLNGMRQKMQEVRRHRLHWK